MNKKLDYYSQGIDYLDKCHLKKALRYLLKAEKIKKGYASLSIGNTYKYYALCQSKKNRKKAMKWFKLGAEVGHCGSMYNVAVEYNEAYKFKKAKKWFKKTIKCGDNEAYLELGKLYLIEGKINKAIQCLKIFKGDRLKLNISEGAQEDALKILKQIEKTLMNPSSK